MKKRKKVKRPIREPSDHSEEEVEEEDEEEGEDGECYPQMNTPDESAAETDAEFTPENSESDN